MLYYRLRIANEELLSLGHTMSTIPVKDPADMKQLITS